jgi:organic radical activating enzyme
MMDRVKFKFLDIPIIRSCNLVCGGCLTFSDSKQIKGTVRLEDSSGWLEHWADKLDPEIVTVFGGEPLLHPQFVSWCKEVRRLWPNCELRINTNGYYLDKLYDKIQELFTEDIKPQFIVSIQTGHEPYYSNVVKNIEHLKDLVLAHFQAKYPDKTVVWNLWLDEEEIYKKWWRIDINGVDSGIRITRCEQHKIPWQAHYQGVEGSLKPFYDYNDSWHSDNHKFCQAKNFVNLYKGKLYKCPTVAVLEHTLDTFNLTDDPDWSPYLENYPSLDITADNEEIIAWFRDQKYPEKVCNMCGFSGPKYTNGHLNRHELKEGWKYQVIDIDS